MRSSAASVAELQEELRRSPERRHAHRMDAVLLALQGMSYRKIAAAFGHAPRTIAYWVRRYRERGVPGLRESRAAGRPPKLTQAQLAEVERTVHRLPSTAGLTDKRWSARTLAAWIENRFSVTISESHARRILRQFGVRSAWAKKRS